MFIMVIKDQDVIVICRNFRFIQMDNMHECRIGSGCFKSKEPSSSNVYKASFEEICDTKSIARDRRWNSEETLLIWDKCTSNATVADMTSKLEVKPI